MAVIVVGNDKFNNENPGVEVERRQQNSPEVLLFSSTEHHSHFLAASFNFLTL